MTAAIVVSASVIVEHAGPLVGALVVTLPVTLGPAFLFILIDHDVGYTTASAITGLAVNSVSGLFMLLYIVLAQNKTLKVCLGLAIAAWVLMSQMILLHPWTLLEATLLILVIYPACILLSQKYQNIKIPKISRKWYELPVRVFLVCLLMGFVLFLSHYGSPQVTGLLAVYPISTTCTILLIHSRFGGKACAAVISYGLWGMLGIGLGLAAFAFTAPDYGKKMWILLVAVPVVWNWIIWFVKRKIIAER